MYIYIYFKSFHIPLLFVTDISNFSPIYRIFHRSIQMFLNPIATRNRLSPPFRFQVYQTFRRSIQILFKHVPARSHRYL